MTLELDQEHGFTRRNFLQISASTATAMLLTTLPNISWAQTAKLKKVGLEQCLALTPLEMSKQSMLVQSAYRYITETCDKIKNPTLRGQVLQIIQNPAPTFMEIYTNSGARKTLWDKLVSANYINETLGVMDFLPPTENTKQSSQPFYAAPGSGYMSHHAYPGGLATHTAFNIRSSLNAAQGYFETFGYKLDQDVVIASQALHDLHKPWVFQWQEDGTCRKENTLAGQGAHHVLGIAESIYRQLPPTVVVAQACAHNHPGSDKDEAEVISWIKAACIIADKDPIQEGLLANDGITLPIPRRQENFITHLGDHDWVVSGPAVKWTLPALKNIAKQEYKMTEQELTGKSFNQLRNYVFSQISAMAAYQLLVTQGEAALHAKITEIIG